MSDESSDDTYSPIFGIVDDNPLPHRDNCRFILHSVEEPSNSDDADYDYDYDVRTEEFALLWPPELQDIVDALSSDHVFPGPVPQSIPPPPSRLENTPLFVPIVPQPLTPRQDVSCPPRATPSSHAVNMSPGTLRRSSRLARATASPAPPASRRTLAQTPLRHPDQARPIVAPPTPIVPSPMAPVVELVRRTESCSPPGTLLVPPSSTVTPCSVPTSSRHKQAELSQAVPSPFDLQSKLPMESPTKLSSTTRARFKRQLVDSFPTNDDTKHARTSY